MLMQTHSLHLQVNSQSFNKNAQSENQFHAQAKTIARGTRASPQIITKRLEILENLGLWMMLTLGANAPVLKINYHGNHGWGTKGCNCISKGVLLYF